jgi:hypothetical protein
VRWDFVDNVLREIGLPNSLINVIMKGVTSVQTNVNGMVFVLIIFGLRGGFDKEILSHRICLLWVWINCRILSVMLSVTESGNRLK